MNDKVIPINPNNIEQKDTTAKRKSSEWREKIKESKKGKPRSGEDKVKRSKAAKIRKLKIELYDYLKEIFIDRTDSTMPDSSDPEYTEVQIGALLFDHLDKTLPKKKDQV